MEGAITMGTTTNDFLALARYKNLQSLYDNRKNEDLNGDGVVDKKDTKLFNSLDVNGDGKVNSKDLKSINKEVKNLQNSDDTYDLNGDGKLDIKDFYKFSKLIESKSFQKKNYSDELINELKNDFIVKTLDSNNDGQINVIDLNYYFKMQNSVESYLNKSCNNFDTFTKSDVDITGNNKVKQNDLEALKSIVKALEEYTGIGTEFLTTKTADDIDGEIGTFEQGNTGDCWMLAGIRALANNKTGAQVLKDSIRKNDDGTVTVTFGGLGVSYTITPDEINRHDTDDNQKDHFSNGDNDVLVIELACKKLHADIDNGKVKCPKTSNYDECDQPGKITGGWPSWLIYYFTGVKSQVDGYTYHKKSDERIKKNLMKFNSNTAMTFYLKGSKTLSCTDGTKYKYDYTAHAITITNIEKESGKIKTVSFMDPHHNKVYTVSFDEFKRMEIYGFQRADLSKTSTKSDIKDMTGYEPPKYEEHKDNKGNSIVDKTVTLNGSKFLEQRYITAPDGTVTIKNYERKPSSSVMVTPNGGGGSYSSYQDVVKQKIVISPDGTKTTTNYEYKINPQTWKYEVVKETVTVVDKDGNTSVKKYKIEDGIRVEYQE